ncbi:AfsR/SARP family transcriptional regulator [Actinomadura sp. KC06]|uniref:AfsR/SARP family transcriptional regulator n=1 Tax=Actinomadura sp. KC06 TaxID=2530369 RepID=UPI0014052FCF|nr:AfsR/SARP family transcriptional regulator [Actinomadura sp. KC06]
MPGDDMEFRLLGKVEALVRGRPAALGRPMDRLALAALLLAPGGSLTPGELAGRLWEEPPETAPDLARDYLKKLRRHLNTAVPGAGALLPPHDGGYRMLVPRHRVDAHRFLDTADQAQQHVTREPARAAELYRAALAEWPSDASGPWVVEPLAGLPGPWAEIERTALCNRHREALTTCAEIEIRVGGHEQRLIPELDRLLRAAPLDERVAGLLMHALVRAGRRGDALEVFGLTRRRLLDELGQDPAPELTRMHQRVLNDDPTLNDPRPAPLGAPMPSTTTPDHDDQPGEETGHELAGTVARLVAEASRSGGTGSSGTVLIGRLRERFEQDTPAEAALAWLVREPYNADALAALERALLAAIARDAEFAAELRALATPTPVRDERGSVSIQAQSISKSSVFTSDVHISGDFVIN